ncbi:dTMP kinase [bacterium]|nr:dTMP kinase [bacterium]
MWTRIRTDPVEYCYMYIIFEGVVGTGKTTQSKMLQEALQGYFPKKEVLWTREPGGSEIAEAIRKVVQGTVFQEEMDPTCEAYLYAAARAQSLRAAVLPVLERGGIVIADRSVITSVAWQGYGRGMGKEKIMKMNAFATEGIAPDVIFYLRSNLEEALGRTFDAAGDKFEKFPKAFFEMCERGYEEIKSDLRFVSQWEDIDARGTREEVHGRIMKRMQERKLIP